VIFKIGNDLLYFSFLVSTSFILFYQATLVKPRLASRMRPFARFHAALA